ncbi:hypothetical protein BCR37DRAFT_384015 [Protomyces lactucae-debilis]|uniref:DNA repair protein REV1 n=1 Tax=Protomyces lactucae-debilis TaxID=2754530 RepID=A0A1Y2EX50_PROLT|nr:uncharacterized protein BCR37DRAFT_384015 [Protomyces lactucae-debilis]ORY75395.1 hypothetical protein BCR37DRAFT_384015 [Protomyces lactucae-debilis]
MSKRPYAAALAGSSKAAKLADYVINEPDHTSEAYEASEFGGFSDYMRRKKLKLQDQDAQFRANADPSLPKVFQGMVLHINGYTKPGRLELWKSIVAHGGVYKQYLENKTDITHIVCSNLTMKKELEFQKYRVVRPEWITDSIKAGKALPWAEYATIHTDSQQKRLSAIAPSAEPQHDVVQSNSYKRVSSGVPKDIRQEGTTEMMPPESARERQSGVKTSTHPDFIQDYYAKSRLHHLSAWKADLRLKVHNLQPNQGTRIQKIVMHIDFDCFFAAVSSRDRPDLIGLPTAVTHGGSNSGEIASCNYKAREYGVKNGMWMKDAVQLCPQIVSLPYDFQAYEAASNQFYEVLLSLGAACIEAVSIDEALVDITNLLPSLGSLAVLSAPITTFCETLRMEMFERTGCEVSIGVGSCVLQAKLATRLAKPAGYFLITPANLSSVLEKLTSRDLPGIGSATANKILNATGAESLPQLQALSEQSLKDLLGPNSGTSIFNACRGIDTTLVGNLSDRKLVSIEINWGIRFSRLEEVRDFLGRVAVELQDKLTRAGFSSARHLSIKIMRRAQDAPVDPPKFLGHGKCDKVNAGREIPSTNEASRIAQHAIGLLETMNIPPWELRGVGVALTKLDTKPVAKQRDMAEYFQVQTSRIAEKTSSSDSQALEISEMCRKPSQASLPHAKPYQPARSLLDTQAKQNTHEATGLFHLPEAGDFQTVAPVPGELHSQKRESMQGNVAVSFDGHFGNFGEARVRDTGSELRDTDKCRDAIGLPWPEASALSTLGLSDLQHTKDYITSWITMDSPQGPDEVDMQDFSQFLLFLVDDADFEKLEELLRWMGSLVRKTLEPTWSSYFLQVAQMIRERMQTSGQPFFKGAFH